ncbi:MAG: helix-turn-helix domain-containing protein [Duganella sp.]
MYVEDGRLWTSAGVTTGIDMTLQMVADDVGESIANAIAKRLVIATRRPGYLSQVSAVIAAHEKADPDFSALLLWLQAHLSEPLDVASMAARISMSPRTFHRKFTSRFQQTPARFVETLRLEHAQSLLRGGLAIKFIAGQCGYNDFS